MQPKHLLSSRLVESVSARLGDRLLRATYQCLEFEIGSASELEDPNLYIGGELHLAFDGGLLIVTWDQNAGWTDHFSLYAGAESLFLDATLTPWPGSNMPPWRDCVGRELTRATVFADDATPHVLALRFGDNVAIVGTGYRNSFGAGDDLLVRDKRGFAEVKTWDIMWDSG